MFEEFELAEIGIPGRDGTHLYQFIPEPGVYMIEGAYIVEIQEIVIRNSLSRVIIVSTLDGERPIHAYLIGQNHFNKTLYFDTINLRIYTHFEKGDIQYTFYYSEEQKKELIHEEVRVHEIGLEPIPFDLSLIKRKNK